MLCFFGGEKLAIKATVIETSWQGYMGTRLELFIQKPNKLVDLKLAR